MSENERRTHIVEQRLDALEREHRDRRTSCLLWASVLVLYVLCALEAAVLVRLLTR